MIFNFSLKIHYDKFVYNINNSDFILKLKTINYFKLIDKYFKIIIF